MTRNMLLEANLPQKLLEKHNTENHVQNRLPTKSNDRTH